ncbi:MAG: hypothetical protein ACD_73C00446G0003 [uncultured bacterium]|nr:MAG: hypothetical protein ACD_73C00446G0003 [uncultured bacterium]
MKKNILIVFVCFLILSPALALADHHLVFISTLIRINDTECAIELTLSGANQDAFATTDNIRFDSTAIVTFENLLDSINADDGNNDVGDNILITSNSFETSSGITADLTFADSNCADLGAETIVEFNNDGSTLIDSIDISEIPDFRDNTAITKTSLSATPDLVDLDLDSVTIGNNSAQRATLGEITTDAGVGCSLQKIQNLTQKQLLPLILLAGSQLLLALRLRAR